MNANRFFVAMTAGLLTAPEHRYANACARASEFYDLDRLYRPGKVGAAVRDAATEPECVLPWLARKRDERLHSVHVEVQVPNDRDDSHLLAGFAGGLPIVLRLTSKRGKVDYVAGTVSGPMLLMTTSDLIELLQRQAEPSLYWDCVLGEVNSFKQCNGYEEIGLEELRAFLLSGEGKRAWEFIGDQVFRELQVEACVHERDFIVPHNMRNLVCPVEPLFDSMPHYVWLEPFDEDAVTGAHLLRLVEAQAFAGRIWELCADRAALKSRLGDDFVLDEFPVLRAAAWPGYLLRLSADDVVEFRDEIIELVRQECQCAGTEPVIPEDLRDIFGPDEENRRRLAFRRRLQHDMGWALLRSPQPWRLAVLDRIDEEMAPARQLPIAQARMEFTRTLGRVERFARQVDSCFADHFQAALRFATLGSAPDDAGPAAIFDQYSQLSGPARTFVETTIDMFDDFGWSKERIFGLAAVSLADVFGGMGSWNDQGFEGPEQETFEQLSAELFGVLNRYFESLVSMEV